VKTSPTLARAYQRAFEHSPLPCTIVDCQQQCVVWANRRSCNGTKGLPDRDPPPCVDPARRQNEEVLRTNRPVTTVETCATPSGQTLHVRLTRAPLTGTAVVVMCEDVTARVQLWALQTLHQLATMPRAKGSALPPPIADALIAEIAGSSPAGAPSALEPTTWDNLVAVCMRLLTP
jgi:hypothetical protein